jgi:hypothetical protein
MLVANEGQQLRPGVALVGDHVTDVRAVEARDEDARIGEREPLDDLDWRVCGSAVAVSATRGTVG